MTAGTGTHELLERRLQDPSLTVAQIRWISDEPCVVWVERLALVKPTGTGVAQTRALADYRIADGL